MNIIFFNKPVVNDHGYFNRRRRSPYGTRSNIIRKKPTSCFTKTTGIVKKYPYSSATSTFIYFKY
jgi:hypothetical protein